MPAAPGRPPGAVPVLPPVLPVLLLLLLVLAPGGRGAPLQPQDSDAAAVAAAAAAGEADVPSSCRPSSGRFLAFGPDNGVCAGSMHQRESLACALAEAAALNRTLVLPDRFCSKAAHIEAAAHELSDIAEHYDLPHLCARRPVLRASALAALQLPPAATAVVGPRAPHAQLHSEPALVAAVVLRREGWGNGTRRHWFKLCAAEPVLQALRASEPVASALRPPANVRALRDAILRRLGPTFGALHVRRGDKARRTDVWPHLAADTQAEAILRNPRVLAAFPANSTLYIATNEFAPHFFDPLKARYTVYTAQDFLPLLREHGVQLRSYNMAEVDYMVFAAGSPRLETFNDLTADARNRARPD